MTLRRLFLAHPDAVNETYGEHFGVAMRYSGRLAAASFCAATHAVLPFLFERTASSSIRRMVADMDRRTAPAQPGSPASFREWDSLTASAL